VKVTHISQFDRYGGAGRAAYRLHEGLRRSGHTSRMLVARKETNDADVRTIRHTRVDWTLNKAGNVVGVQHPFLPSTFRLLRDPWIRDTDVVQLANVHGGFFGHTVLPFLSRRKTVVWCLHDMWAFTGHCGYALDSSGWLTGCGSCPYLDTYPPVRRDATHANWRIKQLVYRRSDLTIVAPSRWLAGLAGQSPLLSGFRIDVIPYGVDLDIFCPGDRAGAREELGLVQDRPVVLALGLEHRKGLSLFAPILARAARELEKGFCFLAVGGEHPGPMPEPVDVVHLESVTDEERVAQLYTAADVFLLPTAMDNLPNTVLESAASGVPVVAARVGGVPEAVADGETGLLRPLDADALGEALGRMLADAELRARLGAAARLRAVEQFGLGRQAEAYLGLYGELTAARARATRA
jgi:glycosyltransferase involved in cell wall biosynthesis